MDISCLMSHLIGLVMNESCNILDLQVTLDLIDLMSDVSGGMHSLVDLCILVVIITVGVEGVQLGVLVVLQNMGHLLLDRVGTLA